MKLINNAVMFLSLLACGFLEITGFIKIQKELILIISLCLFINSAIDFSTDKLKQKHYIILYTFEGILIILSIFGNETIKKIINSVIADEDSFFIFSISFIFGEKFLSDYKTREKTLSDLKKERVEKEKKVLKHGRGKYGNSKNKH